MPTNTTVTTPEGYFSGVLDIYYAKMTTEDSATSAPVYATPAVLAKTIDVDIQPNYKEGKVYASNVSTRNEKRIDSYTVKLNLDKIPYAVREVLLGRHKDANGVQIIKGGQVAPYVAILFALTLDDDSKELWALYKGKFAEPQQTGHTDSDTMTYQHPTIEATFIRRANDNALAAVVATNALATGSTVAANWFTSVYTEDNDPEPELENDP